MRAMVRIRRRRARQKCHSRCARRTRCATQPKWFRRHQVRQLEVSSVLLPGRLLPQIAAIAASGALVALFYSSRRLTGSSVQPLSTPPASPLVFLRSWLSLRPARPARCSPARTLRCVNSTATHGPPQQNSEGSGDAARSGRESGGCG
jgi:hypothetical protein